MMVEIYLENEQDKKELTCELEELIKKVILKTLETENFKFDVIVSVTVTDNENIYAINLEHRGIDRPTDVLSFPVLEFENGKMLENPGDMFEDKIVLGDIVLSLEKAMEQSEDFGHSFFREVGFLVCHSTLHLLGYDHEDDDERAIMREKEEHTLALLNLVR